MSHFNPSMYFSDIAKKIEGQVDAPAQFFQKVMQNKTFLLILILLLSVLSKMSWFEWMWDRV